MTINNLTACAESFPRGRVDISLVKWKQTKNKQRRPKKMKTKNMLVIGMVALAIVIFNSAVNAEDFRLTISRTAGGIGKVSWPAGETDAFYRVLNSTNLGATNQTWQEVGIVQANEFAFSIRDAARCFRVEKFLPPLTITKYSGFGDSTVVAGANDAKLGSFEIKARKNAYVYNITVSLAPPIGNIPAEYSALTKMYLRNHATGAQIGAVITSLSGINGYSVNFSFTAGGSQVIDLYGDVKMNVNTQWKAYVIADGIIENTEDWPVSFGFVDLQTITIIDRGTLTAANGNMPDSAVLIAGSTGNYMAQYAFSAAYEGSTVDKLKIKIPTSFAYSIAAITIKYMDKYGVVQKSTKVPSLSVQYQEYATATFTGLTFYSPASENATLDVYVDSNDPMYFVLHGQSGAIILAANEGFSATGDSGSVVTSAGPADLTGNTFFIRKSKPTFAKLDAGTDPVNGPLYRFSVVADAAGNIDIKKLSFRVSAVGCQVSGLYLYDPSSNVVLTGIVNPIGEIAGLPIGAVDDERVLTISTTPKIYELRGTVTGYGQAGDSITVGFARDMFAPQDGTAYGISVGSYNVWSDRSSFSHSVSSRDWTDGSLLGDMSGIHIFTR